MKILIICSTMEYLSGSPMYNLTLAKELVKEHEVSILSRWSALLEMEADNAGIRALGSTDEHYDLVFVSQRDFPIPSADKVVHIIHSEYECETPREGMEHYVAIRPSIKEHLITEHNIPEDKITVVYNGVDLERFKPVEKSNRDFFKVVIPATRDSLRQRMFDYYVGKASKDYQVFIYGKQFGANIPSNDFVHQSDQVHNIEDFIGDADLVAGILLGRVNLEARAMGVKSMIHNPDNPEDCYEYFPEWGEFVKNHDIKNVAKQLLSI